ncbi:CHAT domain-containing protein [Spirosoma gilvum]
MHYGAFITDLFYQQLLNGLPKDVALQQAKLEFYRTASRSDQLPSQWAGLILIGKADPLLNSWKWIWLFGGASVVVCMVLGRKWWRGKGSTVTKERLNEST